jgi:hypothetical protein
MAPWHSVWWDEIVRCAERGGKTAADIIEKVSLGHAMGWPVDNGFLVLERTTDDKLRIWLGVGLGVRDWCRSAEREVSAFAREIGCHCLSIEGRRGWRRILPHWTQVGDDLELKLT